MSEDELMRDARSLVGWSRYRFMLFVGVSIVIALILVGVALALYGSSGAAQLDLSRPGYQSVRDKAEVTPFAGFSETGTLDAAAVQEFRTLYQAKAKELTSVESFGGSVMSDKALSIDAP